MAVVHIHSYLWSAIVMSFLAPPTLPWRYLSLHLSPTQVPITNLSQSKANGGSCPLPSHVESQKPGGILAKPTFYLFSSRFHGYFVEVVEFLASDFI